MYFILNTKQRITQNNRINGIPYCNKTDFVKIEIVNADTTRIIIPGGLFRPVPTKSQRSIIHLGTGKNKCFSVGKLVITRIYKNAHIVYNYHKKMDQ